MNCVKKKTVLRQSGLKFYKEGWSVLLQSKRLKEYDDI